MLMDFWREFLQSNWGKEFVAGGFGGIAATIAGHPLDTLRIRQQSSNSGSAFSILRQVVVREGPCALYRGMGAPLATVTLQNAIVFQIYAILSRALDSSVYANTDLVPSYKDAAIAGVGAGVIQCLLVSPVELVKIRLQLCKKSSQTGPITLAKTIFKTEGIKGLFRGFNATVLRDAPSHGVYFLTYEYMREQLHPGCRENGDESLRTMLISGGLAGASSWLSCYPFDVAKTKLQAQSPSSRKNYSGVVDCLQKCVKQEGHGALWRGLRTTIARAFVVNGAIFAAYETAMRFLKSKSV